MTEEWTPTPIEDYPIAEEVEYHKQAGILYILKRVLPWGKQWARYDSKREYIGEAVLPDCFFEGHEKFDQDLTLEEERLVDMTIKAMQLYHENIDLMDTIAEMEAEEKEEEMAKEHEERLKKSIEQGLKAATCQHQLKQLSDTLSKCETCGALISKVEG